MYENRKYIISNIRNRYVKVLNKLNKKFSFKLFCTNYHGIYEELYRKYTINKKKQTGVFSFNKQVIKFDYIKMWMLYDVNVCNVQAEL
jgi:hypothetical protein